MVSIAERHQQIIDRLQQEGKVNAADLCTDMNVSSVTIRKDLKLLEDKGLLFRMGQSLE
ncbi:DeoR-like protein with HTH domain [Pontibacter mucosus]|uniref:DeoR-like protein with HTH domain n=1 Tax=Pontibacter mucosus TaxID=1649266 RepID=A0A2T5YHU3_9BACT|nr:DeoR family transcriptional regulator [Pontibacter mucosus]PTX18871.1 DeoR-like protein with HTH domain [Pontibacter mucosus]